MSDDDFIQGRGEASAIVVGFVFGIFSVLAFPQSVVIGSATWIILSIIYALLVLGTFLSFRGWAWNAIIADNNFQEALKRDSKKAERIKAELRSERTNWLTKIIVPDFSSPDKPDRLVSRMFIPVTGMIIPIVGAALWFLIAFHQDLLPK